MAQLDGEGLAVGHLAGLLVAAARGGVGRVGPDAPGFMKATIAPPSPGPSVAFSWASAITSPREDSPAVSAALVMSAVMVPMTRFSSGPAMTLYLR